MSHANVLGILSLMFWALAMIVGLKYLTLVFRANNHGECTEIALIALIRGKNGPSANRRRLGVVALGLFAANISKIFHGAWFPLVIGATFLTLMLTWAKSRGILAAKLHKVMPPVHQFIVDLVSVF